MEPDHILACRTVIQHLRAFYDSFCVKAEIDQILFFRCTVIIYCRKIRIVVQVFPCCRRLQYIPHELPSMQIVRNIYSNRISKMPVGFVFSYPDIALPHRFIIGHRHPPDLPAMRLDGIPAFIQPFSTRQKEICFSGRGFVLIYIQNLRPVSECTDQPGKGFRSKRIMEGIYENRHNYCEQDAFRQVSSDGRSSIWCQPGIV